MKKGFTLIELLVVIAIIGIFASVVTVSLSGSKERARDVIRMGDLKSLSQAAELYFSENGVFPNELDSDGMASYFTDGIIPTDPKTHDLNSYAYAVDNDTAPKVFCIGVEMETISDMGDSCDEFNLGSNITYKIKGP